MINKGQLWHEKLTYEQVCSAGEEDPSKVIYNLHEDCLCLIEDNAGLNQQLATAKQESLVALEEALKAMLINGFTEDCVPVVKVKYQIKKLKE